MLLTKLKTVVATSLLIACVALGLFQVSRIGAQADEPRPKSTEATAKTLPAPDLPVGKWTVEFANGVTEVCEINKDGTATVVEPKRTSAGKATLDDGSFKIVYEDNRVERWTPVGKRLVVEHWFPGNQEPAPMPVLGVAVRIGETETTLTADEKRWLKEDVWPVMSKAEIGSRLTDEQARKLIDPGYVKEHNLTEGAFPMARFVRGSLYANDLCDDYRTGIMIVDTDEQSGPARTKELFVFQLKYYRGDPVPGRPGAYHPGKAYIVPPSPPDPITKSFKPWIFRMRL